MGRIISPAGDASFRLKGVGRHGNNLVITGRMMSAWDVKVYLSFTEMLRAVSTSILLIIVMPVTAFITSFRKQETKIDKQTRLNKFKNTDGGVYG